MDPTMRRATMALCALLACALPPGAGGAPALGAEAGFSSVLDVCDAVTLDEAAARGALLGWAVAPEDRGWRTAFERHNGGTVRVVGWRRGEREGDGMLSYWAASGPSAHRACSFSTQQPGLLDALRGRFGDPETLEEQGDIVSAFWRRTEAEVSFTRVGASSGVVVSRRG
jgi:hypothetical protein